MEARTPFDRAIACLLAAGMGWVPILGFIAGLRARIEPGIAALITHWVKEEVLFILSAFFVCAFLHYLVGDRPWLRPYARRYSLATAMILLVLQALFVTAWFAGIL